MFSSCRFARLSKSTCNYYCSRQYVAPNHSLKLFYLLVHPDMFPHESKEKKLNEESLKIFHSYVNAIERNIPVFATTVTFYKANHDGECSEVKLHLKAKSKQVVIQDIHTAFNFNVHSKPESSLPEENLGEWENGVGMFNEDQNLYAKYMGNLSFGEFKKDTQETLQSWIEANTSLAYKNQCSSAITHTDNIKRLEKLKKWYGVAYLATDITYTYAVVSSVLKQLEKVLERYFKNFSGLKGRILIFGNFNGLDQWGRFVLNVHDVPDAWKQALSKISQDSHLLQVIESTEKKLSTSYNGLKFLRKRSSSPLLPIRAYHNGLNVLLQNSLTENKCNNGSLFENIKAIPEWYDQYLSISDEGIVKVPVSINFDAVFEFLKDNTEDVHEKRQDYLRSLGETNKALQMCKNVLDVKHIDRDPSLSNDKISKACKRLCDGENKLVLKGLVVILSTYYSVSADGFVYIPWNFV